MLKLKIVLRFIKKHWVISALIGLAILLIFSAAKGENCITNHCKVNTVAKADCKKLLAECQQMLDRSARAFLDTYKTTAKFKVLFLKITTKADKCYDNKRVVAVATSHMKIEETLSDGSKIVECSETSKRFAARYLKGGALLFYGIGPASQAKIIDCSKLGD